MTYPITELYAWIVDDPTGQHGIVAWVPGDGSHQVQAVTSERRIADKIASECQLAANTLKMPVRLQRFVLAETVKELR